MNFTTKAEVCKEFRSILPSIGSLTSVCLILLCVCPLVYNTCEMVHQQNIRTCTQENIHTQNTSVLMICIRTHKKNVVSLLFFFLFFLFRREGRILMQYVLLSFMGAFKKGLVLHIQYASASMFSAPQIP